MNNMKATTVRFDRLRVTATEWEIEQNDWANKNDDDGNAVRRK